MHKDIQTSHSRTQENEASAACPEESIDLTASLLPIPDEEDVAGFIALYQAQYGVELEQEKAHEILGGLMRFLYLTRRRTHVQPIDG